jgi:uncharacterized protein YndB with AHSA1/START domain
MAEAPPAGALPSRPVASACALEPTRQLARVSDFGHHRQRKQVVPRLPARSNLGRQHAPSQGEGNMPNTVRLHRVLRAPPERVYRAFLDADALAKWMAPHGFTGKVHHMEPKVGGTYKMSFTNFSSGRSHSFGGEYLELVPNERIRHTDRFDDPNLPGTLMVTVSLRAVSCGTELTIVQEGIPDVIPLESCYLGWQESLTLLGQLVEAEIPG